MIRMTNYIDLLEECVVQALSIHPDSLRQAIEDETHRLLGEEVSYRCVIEWMGLGQAAMAAYVKSTEMSPLSALLSEAGLLSLFQDCTSDSRLAFFGRDDDGVEWYVSLSYIIPEYSPREGARPFLERRGYSLHTNPTTRFPWPSWAELPPRTLRSGYYYSYYYNKYYLQPSGSPTAREDAHSSFMKSEQYGGGYESPFGSIVRDVLTLDGNRRHQDECVEMVTFEEGCLKYGYMPVDSFGGTYVEVDGGEWARLWGELPAEGYVRAWVPEAFRESYFLREGTPHLNHVHDLRVEGLPIIGVTTSVLVRRFPEFYANYYPEDPAQLQIVCANNFSSADLQRIGARSRGSYYASPLEVMHLRACSWCGGEHPAHVWERESQDCRRSATMDVVHRYHPRIGSLRVHRAPRYSPTRDYTVGFEVEKYRVQNLDGSEACSEGDYVDKTPLFAHWEFDRSCGVEGVTHAYSVDRYRLFASHARQASHLLAGDVSTMRDADREGDGRRRFTCGGHVTLNGPGVSMVSVRRYAGLTYALYKKRLRNSYCCDNKDLQSSGRDVHYCAVRERGPNSVEFRLVRRVVNHDNLLWRFRFFRHMAKAIETNMSFGEYLTTSRPLLREVYKGRNLNRVLNDAAKFDDYLNRGYIHPAIAEYI
jgi:hypothetical protein